MTKDDLAAVLSLSHMVPEAPWWNEAHVRQMISPPDDDPSQVSGNEALSRRGWVAIINGTVKGFLVLQVLRMPGIPAEVEGEIVEGEIESVVVHPGTRRRGLAHALLATTLAWCSRHSVSVIRLEVRSQNMPAIALYQHARFNAVGTRFQYYQSPADDAVLMECRLPDLLSSRRIASTGRV